MKETKKTTKKVSKKEKTKSSETRLKELEDLIVLMDEKILSFNQRVDEIESSHKTIKTRLGV